MKRFLIATAITIALISSAKAKDKPPEDFSLMGVGTQTCTQFASIYRQQPKIAENLFFSWAEGYMSAMNMALMAAKIPPKNLAAMSIDDEERYLRTYCNTHPLADYTEGVLDLINSLPDSTFDPNSVDGN